MALHADDAHDRVEQLTALTRRLTERLSEEADLFEARRPQDVAPGLAETQRLANLYRHESARVKADPGLIAGAAPAARAALLKATEAFEAALKRHAHAVEAARTLTEGLVQAIAREIADARAPAAYGAGGFSAQGDVRAVTLNRQA